VALAHSRSVREETHDGCRCSAGTFLNVATIPSIITGAESFHRYAIANPSNANINVKIDVVDVNGHVVQTLNLPSSIRLGPAAGGQISPQDVPSLLTFQGSMF